MNMDNLNIILAADRTVHLYPVTDEIGQAAVILSGGHEGGISDLAWSPDSKLLATASDDKTVGLWNVEEVQIRFIFICLVEIANLSLQRTP